MPPLRGSQRPQTIHAQPGTHPHRPTDLRRGDDYQRPAQALHRGHHAQRARAPGENRVLPGQPTHDGRAAFLSRVVNAQVSLGDKLSRYNQGLPNAIALRLLAPRADLSRFLGLREEEEGMDEEEAGDAVGAAHGTSIDTNLGCATTAMSPPGRSPTSEDRGPLAQSSAFTQPSNTQAASTPQRWQLQHFSDLTPPSRRSHDRLLSFQHSIQHATSTATFKHSKYSQRQFSSRVLVHDEQGRRYIGNAIQSAPRIS